MGYVICSFFWLEWNRKHSFYGISKDKVWVKQGLSDLKCYPVEQLPRLKIEKQNIYYSTIKEQTYTKYLLLQNIKQAPAVYDLIKECQQA